MAEEPTAPKPPNAPAGKPLWRRPVLRRDEDEDREHKTVSLELFLDLIFAVVIDNVTHQLTATDVSWLMVGNFCLYFVPVWWVWMGCTYYNDRFETNDVSHRLFTFLMILPLAGMAYSAGTGTAARVEDPSAVFAWSYAAARAILIGMWLRAGWHSPEARPLTSRYAVGFSASAALWAASALVPAPWRFVLWGAGLLIDLVTPITTFGIQTRLPRLSTSHLPERYGTITLMVLGECVGCVIQGLVGAKQTTPGVAAQGALGLALCFGIWWIYFDHVMGRRSRFGVGWSSAWGYAHLPLLIALTSVAVAVRSLVSDEHNHLFDSVRWLACGAMAVALVALAVIEGTLRKEQRAPGRLWRVELLRLAGAAAALLLGLFGAALHPTVLIALLVAIAAGQVIHGLYHPTQAPAAEALGEKQESLGPDGCEPRPGGRRGITAPTRARLVGIRLSVGRAGKPLSRTRRAPHRWFV